MGIAAKLPAMGFPDRLAQALEAASFTPDERTYATREQCGTFALVLYDLLAEHSQLPQIVAFGNDPNWDSPWLHSPLGYKLPGLIRRPHLNHIAVRLEDRFFDINGEAQAADLANAYDANGMIALDRAVLRRKVGSSYRQPLYFDAAFYFDAKRRLSAALASPDIRL